MRKAAPLAIILLLAAIVGTLLLGSKHGLFGCDASAIWIGHAIQLGGCQH